MRSHELAKRLQERPDMPVYVIPADKDPSNPSDSLGPPRFVLWENDSLGDFAALVLRDVVGEE